MDQITTRPPAAQFDHYGISVADLDRSLDFYRDILGAATVLSPHSVEEFGFRRAVIWLNDSMGVDLNEHTANTGEAFDPARTGLDHLAFRLDSHEALLSWRAHLDAKGVACSPIRNVEGVGEAFDFCDPDGIPIEFWHHDADGSWPAFVNQKLERTGETS